MTALPAFLTADLPGTGGALKTVPEDFFVEELPAYQPSGNGDHVFVTIEKRGLGTHEAIGLVARALGIGANDVGCAGMKDRHAVTRQRLSLPPPITPEQALGLTLEGITVLAAERHEHKLRTGHLAGNRFIMTVRGLAVPSAMAAERAGAILTRLARPPGVPNWYGEQRFGARGDNAARGRALVLGERPVPPPRDKRERRLLVSAFQSELFNQYLEARLADGLLHRVISGDILQKTDTGGIFETPAPEVDEARLATGAVAPTGPMYGHEMRQPTAGTDAAAREAAVLAGAGITTSDFARVSGLAEGTRRPLAVAIAGASCRAEGDDAIVVELALPSGAYATVVMAEVMKDGSEPVQAAIV